VADVRSIGLRLQSSSWWRRRIAALGLLGAGILVVSPLLFFAAEHNANPDITTVRSSYTWLIRTLLEGGSPYGIATGAGYVVYYLIQASGVAVVASLTAALTTRLVSSVLSRGTGMGEARVRDHIVICGWGSKGPEILRELHAPEVMDKRPVVVLVDREALPLKDPLVTFIRGKPTSAEDLTRAGVCRAQCAIILADESDPNAAHDDIDARTLLTTLAVESLNPNCYTCVEVIRSENRDHFLRTKADELVVSAELGGALLAGSATTHGLSRLVSDLVTHPEGTEFYRIKPPDDVVGLRFPDAMRVMKEEHDAVLVAVFDGDGGYVINPDKNHTLQADEDVLIITCSLSHMALKDPPPKPRRARPRAALGR
jgi:voltage-gated potassium channel